ncbi:MAG: EVE domain-containing protein, partial [Bacteroidia bacterium]
MAWLVKSEPQEYSFQDLAQEGRVVWDGVRNFQARRYLAQMQMGDKVLFYHSVQEKAIVGLAQVVRTAFPDPQNARWLAVELAYLAPLHPIPLTRIKSDPKLQKLLLVRQPRLSVMPVPEELFHYICYLGSVSACFAFLLA